MDARPVGPRSVIMGSRPFASGLAERVCGDRRNDRQGDGWRRPFELTGTRECWARCPPGALRDAAADVVMKERVAGHDDAMWQKEFPLMVAWAFGGSQAQISRQIA